MKQVLGCIRRADERYNMIQDGDKICVGVSGGKDSLLLMYGLKLYQLFSKKKYDLCAVMLDLGIVEQDTGGIEIALLGQLRKGHPVVRTACHNRFIARNAGQFPTLTYQPFIGFQSLEREYAVSSPQGFLEYIRKTEQFIFHIPSVKNRPKLRNSYNTSK